MILLNWTDEAGINPNECLNLTTKQNGPRERAAVPVPEEG